MVYTLQYSSNFNPAASYVPGVYAQVMPPTNFPTGGPSNIAFVEGTASWGPANQAVFLSSYQGSTQKFGGIQAASYTDYHDLCTDLMLAFAQAGGSQAALNVWGVRSTDGTDTAASVSLTDDPTVANVAQETVTVSGTLTVGDQLKLTITNSKISATPVVVEYTTVTADTVDTMAAGLAAAINANTTLHLANMTATVAAAEVTISYPILLGSVTFAESITGTATETLTLAAGTNQTVPLVGIKLTAKYTGSMGNKIAVFTAPSAVQNALDVTIVPFSGGGRAEVFIGIPTGGTGSASAGVFWNALANAINNGIVPKRGPSNWVTASLASNWAETPAVPAARASNNFALTGGTDGRNVTSSQMLGTQSPATGVYLAPQLTPPPSVCWLAGCTDNTIFSEILASALGTNLFWLFGFPINTDVPTATTLKYGWGISDYHVGFVLDWVIFNDPVNGQKVLPALGAAGGAIACLAPWNSPYNIVLQGILGTVAGVPYSFGDISQASQNGILLIEQRPAAGGAFVFRNSVNSVGAADDNGLVSYSRMTNYLVNAIGNALEPFGGKLQSSLPNDPVRSQVRAVLNALLQPMQDAGAIESFNNVSDTSNNTVITVAEHELFVLDQVKYMSEILYIGFTLQGGVTVIPGSSIPGATTTGTGG